jgi:hypothetical protein
LIISSFNKNIAFYEVKNRGFPGAIMGVFPGYANQGFSLRKKRSAPDNFA